jgi:hypothetical protein
MAATRSAAAGAGSGDALASSDSKPALMRMATRTYRELIWSLAFGLVTVATVSRHRVIASGSRRAARGAARLH